MSDELKKEADGMIERLVKDVKSQMPTVQKVKEIAKLAKEIGEDTEAVDRVVEVIEGFGNMLLKRFDKSKKQE